MVANRGGQRPPCDDSTLRTTIHSSFPSPDAVPVEPALFRPPEWMRGDASEVGEVEVVLGSSHSEICLSSCLSLISGIGSPII